jgi:hypothetical protein
MKEPAPANVFDVEYGLILKTSPIWTIPLLALMTNDSTTRQEITLFLF